MSTTPTPAAAPVAQHERIQTLDVLRGFALFGILTVNMFLFSHPFQAYLLPPGELPWYDQAAKLLILALGEGKFFTLFSLLFGLGFAIQLERAQARGGRFVPTYLRRLSVLLLFGLIHAFFIWIGDILTLYAILGMVLLLFTWVKNPRTLLIWAAIFWIFFQLSSFAFTGLVVWARDLPEVGVEIEAAFAEQMEVFRHEYERALVAYGSGTFGEVTAQRTRDVISMSSVGWLTMAPVVMTMFLIGAYIGRRGLLRDVAAHRKLFRRLMIGGFAIGLPANIIAALLIQQVGRADLSWNLALANLLLGLGGITQSIAYLSAIVLLCQSVPWSRWLAYLAPVGQMGLSNYLFQSIICTFIFYGYGLGLFNQVGMAAGLLLTIVIYAIQIPISHWWMARFRYGPAEWLWRSLTYMRPQPMRRNVNHGGALAPQ
ncbi:DUF418 domain-containing protein [Candidatus Viridilinea mediisalina]|uniref:DUF418 domain-containing protein n=1 Tax=Candidatus Viridilinea mediisalina TaxID=2024553 RepID=A0A2A6RE37_9CHLR|nr:DUF418 domain-containing protein [Candidatus Viridilinea mediisalina]PDW00396.1 hypothetical protein CJ255_20755 [Candidatus Viridilinea mediisalina]